VCVLSSSPLSLSKNLTLKRHPPTSKQTQWRIENFADIPDKVYSEKFEIGTHIW
jgi:hypothetical protein